MNVSFTSDKETGISVCTVENAGIIATGKAKCHPEDMPYYSSEYGQNLACIRARIKYYKKFIRNVCVPQLQTLEHIYHILYSSDKYNEASRKLLKRQIWFTKHDIEIVKEAIASLEQYAIGYIKQKEKFNLRGKTN